MSGDDWGDDDGGWGDDEPAAGDGGGGDDGWGAGDGDAWGGDADFGDDVDLGGDGGQELNDPKFQIENLYHEAHSFRRDDPAVAMEKFVKCIALESEVKDMGEETRKHLFNALSELTKLQCTMGRYSEMQASFKRLLVKAPDMTDNESKQALREVLNEAGQGADPKEVTLLFQTALESLKRMGKRMWFEFGMKLCVQQFKWKQFSEASRTLEELHRTCKRPDGTDDTTKGGNLLEIYAVKFQIAQEQGQSVALDELYKKTHKLAADVNDSRVMSVIHDCWGKMFAKQGQWAESYNCFFTSFKQFQEIGDGRATKAIQYAVVANILSNSTSDPFSQREAANKKEDAQVKPVVDLRVAFDNDDIRAFEKVLKNSEATLLGDSFIKGNVQALLLRLRSNVLLKLVAPYTIIKMPYLQKELNAKPGEVENLVVGMILDGRIKGRLDQTNNLLDLSQNPGDPIMKALEGWASTLNRLRDGLCKRAEKVNGRGEGPARMGAFGMGHYAFDEDDQGPQMLGGMAYGF